MNYSNAKTQYNNLSHDTHKNSISKMSGFSYVKNKYRKHYFKKIKYRNQSYYENMKCQELQNKIFNFVFYFLSNFVNFVNVVIFCIVTYKNEKDIHIKNPYQIIDLICSIYFVIEFFFYLFFFDVFKIEYLLLEIISLIPSFILYSFKDYKLRKFFNCFKSIRIIKIYQSLRYLQLTNNKEHTNGRLSNLQIEIVLTILFFLSLYFISSSLLISFQDLNGIKIHFTFNQKMKFFDAFYFLVVTTTTLGYGDYYPNGIFSRFYMIIIILGFISLVTFELSKLVQLMIIWQNYTKYSFKDHIVLVCDNTISLFPVLCELKKDNAKQVIIIISREIGNLESNEFPYNHVYLIKSKEIDLEVLERANLSQAKNIIIFSRIDFEYCDKSEKVNEFIVLKIKEYFNEIPTYVQTLYSERIFSHKLTETGKTMIFKKPTTNKAQGIMGLLNPGVTNKIKIKKIIPIFRIKSLILSKSIFNPGYANFIQNLLFNNFNHELENMEILNFPQCIQAYALGCENRLNIIKFPKYFWGKDFYECLRLIYSKSILNYLTKIAISDLYSINRPILLIGVIDEKRSRFFGNKTPIKLFPSDFKIMSFTPGIFISYENTEENYVQTILNQFPEEDIFIEEREKSKIDNESINSFKSSKNSKEDNNYSLNSMEQKLAPRLQRRGGFSALPDKLFQRDSNINIRPSITINHDNISKSGKIDRAVSTQETINFNNILKSKTKNEKKVKNLKSFTNYGISQSEGNSPRNTYVKRKTKFITGMKKFSNDEITNNNLIFLQSFNDKALIDVQTSLLKKIHKRYDNKNYKISNENIIRDFYENRIIDVAHKNIKHFIHKHIIIFGFQDGLVKLIQLLSYHFPNKSICIFCDNSKANEKIFKLMCQFQNLFYLKGNYTNPYHLININLEEASFVFYLIENLVNPIESFDEDLMNILSYRSINFYFNVRCLIELNNISSLNYLGTKIISNKKLYKNEFFHPLFMQGQLLYLNHFNRIICMAEEKENIINAWIELLSLGINNEMGLNGKKNKEGIPLTITLDVPESYIGKEFSNLFTDMICLKNPLMILGIYIDNPLEYWKLKNEGKIRINLNQENHKSEGIDIFTSHNTFMNGNSGDFNFFKMSKKLKEKSFNDKINLDNVDISHPYWPIFITNPPPWLLLTHGCRMLILCNNSESTYKDVQMYQKEIIQQLNKRLNRIKNEKKEYKELIEKHERINDVFSTLKKKLQDKFDSAQKVLDARKRTSNIFD